MKTQDAWDGFQILLRTRDKVRSGIWLLGVGPENDYVGKHDVND
jgi:hypothetical protein